MSNSVVALSMIIILLLASVSMLALISVVAAMFVHCLSAHWQRLGRRLIVSSIEACWETEAVNKHTDGDDRTC